MYDAFQWRSRLYHDLGKYDKAIADFTEVIRIDHDHNHEFYYGTTAYYERGLSYHKLREYDKAIEDFTEEIRIDPDTTEAYYERGTAYHEIGEYDKAIADLTKVIADYTEVFRKNPNLFGVFSQAWAKAHYNRGSAYQELGDKDKAASDFARAKELRYDSGRRVASTISNTASFVTSPQVRPLTDQQHDLHPLKPKTVATVLALLPAEQYRS